MINCMINLFSLRVNTPLLAALLLEISFVEIPRSLLRGVSFAVFHEPTDCKLSFLNEQIDSNLFQIMLRIQRVLPNKIIPL
jgi:hypothetical protein